MAVNPKPAPFLEVRIHSFQPQVGLTALCAGYEAGHWRGKQFAGHLMEWLPDFTFHPLAKPWISTYKEGEQSRIAAKLLAKAVNTVYISDKDRSQNGIGEILLHAAVRQVFDTVPAIAKLYLHNSPHDTIDEFEAVHIVAAAESLQLWLGEAHFSDDINGAIKKAVKSLNEQVSREYLKTEFIAILNKPDPGWPHFDKIKLLYEGNISLDKIFDAVCIPVFLTYNSAVIAMHTEVTENFSKKFEIEIRKYYDSFCSNRLPEKLIIHLFLLPLKNKTEFEKEFEMKLQACQSTLG